MNHDLQAIAAQLKTQAFRRREALTAHGCATYTLGYRDTRQTILCLCCGFASFNQNDASQRFCGFCEAFHSEEVAPPPLSESRPLSPQDLGVIYTRNLERRRYAYPGTDTHQVSQDIDVLIAELMRLRELLDQWRNQSPFPPGMIELPPLGGQR